MALLILVGFAEATSAPEVVWSLVDQGFQVCAFARRGRRCALLHSRHVRCFDVTPPELDADSSLSDLRQLVARLGGNEVVLFPLDDAAVWLSCRVAERSGLVLAGPSVESSEIALNKQAQLDFARAAGFNVLPTTVCTTVEQATTLEHSFPLIMRPAKAIWKNGDRLSKGGLWICGDSREFEKAIAIWAGTVPVLVQTFVSGCGEGVFGIATERGVRAWSAHKRLRMMNPHGSGSSASVSQPISAELEKAASRFIESIKWRGLFMIEILRDKLGRAWFVEFNGRPWGSMALARRQGLEYPAWHVHLALKPASEVGTGRSGKTKVVCRNLAREFLHLLFVLRGPKSMALTEWPSFWKAAVGVLRIHKGDSICNWRKDDPKVLLSDCYYTVRNNVFKSLN